MTRMVLIFALFVGLGCGQNSSKPSPGNMCDAYPSCPEGYEEGCDDEAECIRVELCDESIMCQPCTATPECPDHMVEVETCVVSEASCHVVFTECNSKLYCEVEEISASDFEQSCEFSSECLLINEGNPCDCHECADAAINVSSEADYEAATGEPLCGDVDCPAVDCPMTLLPFCDAGACEPREAKFASTEGFDASCETADDCAAVVEAEVCDVCACPNAAVSASELEDYNTQFDVDCAAGIQCGPCQEPAIECVGGTCQLME